jgi:acyl dehydratase
VTGDKTAPARLSADDLTVGQVFELGTYTPTREEIVAFAEQWDPQPFHIDPELAKNGHFGDVIASGAHTLAIYQRLAVAGVYLTWDILAGRSLREVRFHRPVLPGVTMVGRITVQSVDLTGQHRAPVLILGELFTESGERIFSLAVDVIVWRRSRDR